MEGLLGLDCFLDIEPAFAFLVYLRYAKFKETKDLLDLASQLPGFKLTPVTLKLVHIDSPVELLITSISNLLPKNHEELVVLGKHYLDQILISFESLGLAQLLLSMAIDHYLL